jgi:hypothetical protein
LEEQPNSSPTVPLDRMYGRRGLLVGRYPIRGNAISLLISANSDLRIDVAHGPPEVPFLSGFSATTGEAGRGQPLGLNGE